MVGYGWQSVGDILMWSVHLFSGWESLWWKRLEEFICLSDHPCGSHLCTLFIMARRGPSTSYLLTPISFISRWPVNANVEWTRRPVYCSALFIVNMQMICTWTRCFTVNGLLLRTSAARHRVVTYLMCTVVACSQIPWSLLKDMQNILESWDILCYMSVSVYSVRQ